MSTPLPQAKMPSPRVKSHDPADPYDVVFMDWRMPGMNGLQATRLIKEDASLASPPAIVLVTAYGHDDVRENAEYSLIDGYLLKPITASMLMDTLVNLFAGHRETGESRQAIDPVVDRHANSLLGVRILLAEDNEINQQIAVELLEGVGASVVVANDGLEAVEKMLNQPAESMFDVVLMDVQMPRMDGYEATQRLRSEPQFAKLPIIAMTAHATLDQRQKCTRGGNGQPRFQTHRSLRPCSIRSDVSFSRGRASQSPPDGRPRLSKPRCRKLKGWTP